MGSRRRNKRGPAARVTYSLAVLLYALLNRLPRRPALWIGAVGGRLVCALDGRHRRLVQEQLRMAFPDWPSEHIRRTAWACYGHFGRSAAEFARLGRDDRETILNQVMVEGREHLDRALAAGRGVLFLTAHLGNWELMAVVCNLLGYRLYPVARPLDNPWLNRLIDRIRSRHGSTVISKKEESAPRDLIHALRDGACVGILLDQNMATYDGVFVNFFGRPACTAKGLALIARRTGAPVVPAFIAREADSRHRITILPSVEFSHGRDVKADVIANTARCTAIIERMVRRHPDQWLWMHRRWKTQPQAGTSTESPAPVLHASHHLS
ncbi:MAG TPA: lysophospholipid acyltransferase family protein [Nitrospiria bacterium]|nr:lysophospholipid acyltransferase family protein [Nitrospiria bacterium]